MKEKIKLYYQMVGTVDPAIKWALCISTTVILLIEVFFKRFEAPFDWFVVFGNIFVNVCYSVIASCIFYFINQHVPAEMKKIRTYSYVHNKINLLYKEVVILIWRFQIRADEATETSPGLGSYSIDDQILAALRRIDPRTRVFTPGERFAGFENWYAYFEWKYIRLNKLFNDLMLVQDVIDERTLKELLELQTEISTFRNDHFPPIILPTQPLSMEQYIFFILGLHRYSLRALQSFEALPLLYVGKNSGERMSIHTVA